LYIRIPISGFPFWFIAVPSNLSVVPDAGFGLGIPLSCTETSWLRFVSANAGILATASLWRRDFSANVAAKEELQ